MDLRLQGKTAIVSGGSIGIGKAVARQLAREGVDVAITARNMAALNAAATEIANETGRRVLSLQTDTTDDAKVREMVAIAASTFGRIDILVLNAGVLGELAPISDIAPKVWRQVFDVNVEANWRLLRALDPYLRASEAARVLVITSRVGGEVAKPFWGVYAASKAALEMLARTYAEEMKSSGVRVALLDPGAMRTKLRASAMPGEKAETLPEPGAIAPLILMAAARSYDGIAARLKRV